MFHIYHIWKVEHKTIKDSGYVLKGTDAGHSTYQNEIDVALKLYIGIKSVQLQCNCHFTLGQYNKRLINFVSDAEKFCRRNVHQAISNLNYHLVTAYSVNEKQAAREFIRKRTNQNL